MKKRADIVLFGPLGPAQLACIRSWKKKELTVGYIYPSQSGKTPWYIKAITDYSLAFTSRNPVTDKEKSTLVNFLNETGALKIVALSYQHLTFLYQLISEHHLETQVLAVPEKVLPFLESKQEQIRLAQSCGFRVRETWHLDQTSYQQIPENAYPVVVRPDGAESVLPFFKVHCFDSPDQLEKFVNSLTSINRPLIAQSFINGTNVIVHGCRHNYLSGSVQQGFLVNRMHAGLSISLCPVSLPEDVLESCQRFCREAAISGIYHFDLRYEKETDTYYFLEVNARLGGTTGKVFRLGFDEPGLLLSAFDQKNNLPASQKVTSATASNRHAIIRSSLETIKSRLTRFDYPQGQRHRILLENLWALLFYRDELYSFRHPVTSVSYFLNNLTGE